MITTHRFWWSGVLASCQRFPAPKLHSTVAIPNLVVLDGSLFYLASPPSSILL